MGSSLVPRSWNAFINHFLVFTGDELLTSLQSTSQIPKKRGE